MIEGEKTQICGITKECAPEILKWVNQPELKCYTGTVYPVSDYEHESWIRRKAESSTDRLFLIKDKASGTDIGTIGLKNLDFINSNVELYISIGNMDFLSENNGGTNRTGYGCDAVTTLTEFCFKQINLHKVYLHVFESNQRAIRCYEKAGFKVEGRLVGHHFLNGKYEDVLVMARIRNEGHTGT